MWGSFSTTSLKCLASGMNEASFQRINLSWIISPYSNQNSFFDIFNKRSEKIRCFNWNYKQRYLKFIFNLFGVHIVYIVSWLYWRDLFREGKAVSFWPWHNFCPIVEINYIQEMIIIDVINWQWIAFRYCFLHWSEKFRRKWWQICQKCCMKMENIKHTSQAYRL